MAPSTYIISRVADPIFAIFIGVGAAATRINREEKEKGRTTQQTLESAKRYVILPNIPVECAALVKICSSFPSRRLGLSKKATA
jgi:hypothetical protein